MLRYPAFLSPVLGVSQVGEEVNSELPYMQEVQ